MGKRTEWPPTERPVLRPVVIAGRSLRRRMGTALVESGMRPAVLIDDPGDLADLDLEDSTIVIFACDVERPAEVTGLRRLCRATPGLAIVVVSPQATATAVRRTLDAGAAALVFEREIEPALVATVRAVGSGQSVVPRRLRAGVTRPNLSHRERQVLILVCDGHTNAEVAEALHLAESTIKSHMASIFTKFGVHSRTEAVAAFFELRERLPT